MVKSKIHNMCLCPEELIHRPLVQIKKWFSIPVSNSHVNNLTPELSFRPKKVKELEPGTRRSTWTRRSQGWATRVWSWHELRPATEIFVEIMLCNPTNRPADRQTDRHKWKQNLFARKGIRARHSRVRACGVTFQYRSPGRKPQSAKCVSVHVLVLILCVKHILSNVCVCGRACVSCARVAVFWQASHNPLRGEQGDFSAFVRRDETKSWFTASPRSVPQRLRYTLLHFPTDFFFS